MSHIHLTKEDMMGSQLWRGGLDLFHIVMIGIGKDLPGQEENYKLHRFLGTIFSQKLAVEEKLHIMKTEYDISEEEDFRKDVNEMCNLGEGIMEEGIAIGETRGIAIGESRTIRSMYKNGFTVEQIAAAIDKDLEEVRAVLTDF